MDQSSWEPGSYLAGLVIPAFYRPLCFIYPVHKSLILSPTLNRLDPRCTNTPFFEIHLNLILRSLKPRKWVENEILGSFMYEYLRGKSFGCSEFQFPRRYCFHSIATLTLVLCQ
jgi:hypothetical protein